MKNCREKENGKGKQETGSGARRWTVAKAYIEGVWVWNPEAEL